ncbi:hypothetical protein J2810_002558 [Chryseobacterium rhizosphaerae]|uniref:hypothetical protein n=1 Tax=Chryseobacterium rhizosphaerae TaxID=395937 RepID=UPI00285D4525|nr:hypothetical protein [Chryseobacterium rhizosphaerae]MDR6546499.1 hypothetical protein [Chryseobacterium rhizosphaerae]
MTNEYRDAVRNHYLVLKEQGIISNNMLYLGPAKVRNECVMSYMEISNHYDMRTLKNFMDKSMKDEVSLMEVKMINPAKFKPLIYFLKKDKNTSELSIEMAAWLLNFTPRPYSYFAYLKHKESGKPVNPYLENHGVSNMMLSVQVKDNETFQDSSQQQTHTLEVVRNELLNVNTVEEESKISETPVMIEYPSGVRVIIKSSDISFISKLIKL